MRSSHVAALSCIALRQALSSEPPLKGPYLYDAPTFIGDEFPELKQLLVAGQIPLNLVPR